MSMTSAASSSTSSSPETACPVCGRALPSSLLPSHVSGCLGDPVNPLALAEDLKAWLEPQFDAMERAGRPVPRLQAFADVLMSYHHRASVLVHGQSSVTEREAAVDAAMDLGSVDDDEQFRLFLEREATCCLCKAVNAEAVIHLEECDHRVCRACLRGSLTSDAPYRERVQCPVAECGQSLPMFVCKVCLFRCPVQLSQRDRHESRPCWMHRNTTLWKRLVLIRSFTPGRSSGVPAAKRCSPRSRATS